MPALIDQIEQAVGGLNLGQLASGAAGGYSGLAQAIGGWQGGPPGAFGAALGGLGSVSAPGLNIAGNLGSSLGGLLPSLQGGGLGGLVQTLQGDVTALPQRLEQDLLGAVKPLLDRVAALQTLLVDDWSCGLVPGAAAPMPAPAPGPAPAPAPGPAPAPAPVQGALGPAQVTAAKALVDALPADLSVPSLMHWLHDRLAQVSLAPGYLSLRALPLIDDLRDPLATLVRWEAASAPAVATELQQTLQALTATVVSHTHGAFGRALPAASMSALQAASPAAPAETYVAALEALATAVQAKNTAQLPARLASAQAARAALLAANADIDALAPQRTALLTALTALPGEFDAGLCRLLVLLQPRPSITDLTDRLGLTDLAELPAEAFAPVQQLLADLSQRLTGLLGLLDIGAVTGPVTDALASANQAVQQVENGLAQLSAQALQALGDARQVVQSLNLDGLRQQAEQALQAITDQLAATIGQALGEATAALGDAMTAVFQAIDAVDPEALTQPVRDAIQALGNLLQQEAVQRLVQVLAQLEQLAAQVAQLKFEPVADEVIATIGKLKQVLQAIDVSKLPSPGPELVDEAMQVLPRSLVPITDPLISELDGLIAGAPTDVLEQVKQLPEQVRARLLEFSPRAALGPVLGAPFRDAAAQLDAFDPLQWLQAADAALAELRQRLAAQLDVAAALAEAARAHAAVLAEMDRFRPSTLLKPLEDTLEQALHGLALNLPLGDVVAALEAALGRVHRFTRTIDAAMDVADHALTRLAGLADPAAAFDAWLEAILAKVPDAASGALATALADLRAAALAVRPQPLATAWAAASTPLATLLGEVQATARLTRLTLARGKVQAGLADAAVAAAVPGLGAWMADPATAGAGAGLNQWAALDRALAAAGSGLQSQFDQLALRFPSADGPLAPLLPAEPDTPRDWVREAAQRQFGRPMLALLQGVRSVTALLAVAVAGLRSAVQAAEAKLNDLLAAPQALATLLGNVNGVVQRLGQLDLGVYTREVDTVYTALLDELRALDPRQLVQVLEATRDRLLALISLDAILPPALRGQLTEAKRQLVAKLGAIDPDALLLEPLEAEYRQVVEPLVAALDVGDAVQLLIDWLNGLPEDLRAQIGRVDQSYGELLAAAPGDNGGGASQGVSL